VRDRAGRVEFIFLGAAAGVIENRRAHFVIGRRNRLRAKALCVIERAATGHPAAGAVTRGRGFGVGAAGFSPDTPSPAQRAPPRRRVGAGYDGR
jgi:hypothetical protein